jgi:hypothetical protein
MHPPEAEIKLAAEKRAIIHGLGRRRQEVGQPVAYRARARVDVSHDQNLAEYDLR